MSICCLTPSDFYSSYFVGRTDNFFMRWWGPLCLKPTKLDVNSVNSLELWYTYTHFALLCALFLLRTNQSFPLSFNTICLYQPMVDRSHDIPTLMRVRWPLHLRIGVLLLHNSVFCFFVICRKTEKNIIYFIIAIYFNLFSNINIYF
jgi:hypothetical protein